MRSRNICSLASVWGSSMSRGRARRQGPWATALAVLVTMLLAAPRRPAQIAIHDGPQVFGVYAPPNLPVDNPISGSEPFTVTSGASVLVVQYGEFAQSTTGLDANTAIFWNGVALTPAVVDISSASSYTYSEIFYLDNPAPGSGTISVVPDSLESLRVEPPSRTQTEQLSPGVVLYADGRLGLLRCLLDTGFCVGLQNRLRPASAKNLRRKFLHRKG